MKVLAIARRELKSLLGSPVGWCVLGGFWLIAGVMWSLSVFGYAATVANQVYDPYAVQQLTFMGSLVGPWLGNIAVVLVLVAPVVSMRSLAEERRSGTLELLKTSPVRPSELVLGKYLGVLGFMGLLLVGTLHAPVGLLLLADPSWPPLVGGYVSMCMLSALLAAIGLFCSSMTESQLLAASMTFAVGLTAYLVGLFDPVHVDSWHVQLSIYTHLESGFRGALRLSDGVYFLAVTATFLVASWQRMENDT